jgi:molybdenum-dependent DNA-binding transcriptional regulator ModE
MRRRAATLLAEALVEDVAGGYTADLTPLARSMLDQYIRANAELNQRLDARKEVA